MTIQIHLTEQQLALFNESAIKNKLTLEEAAQAFFLERLEDLEDLKTAKTILEKMEQTNEQPQPIENLWAELGL